MKIWQHQKTLRNRHVTRFGYPSTKSGALYYISDLYGLEQASIDIDLARLESQGIFLSPIELHELVTKTRQSKLWYESMVQGLGIPTSINKLLSSTSKREVERIAKALIISENMLSLLVHNHSQKNFKHQSKFLDFIPDHLQISDSDRGQMQAGNLRKITRKLSSTLTFRKQMHIHLFESDSQWHFFYFSYQDLEESDKNHWKEGPHLHYISHLWPGLCPQKIWEGFDTRRNRGASGVHVKFIPFEINSTSYHSGVENKSKIDQFFPMNPRLFDGQEPTPPAQLLTRGSWIGKISIPNEP